MNREILFKAKRVDNREWVEGNVIEDGVTGQVFIHTSGNSVNESDKVNEEGCLKFFAFEVDPEIICQYTGLTDKNGKKIWENDILGRDGYWSIRIEFENGSFMVRSADKIQYINNVVYTHINRFNIKEYEVIGNTFDNPELLEVAE